MTALPSARSLHLYASALVARRSRAAAADVHAPGDLVRGLRRVAAAVLRCGFPEAARWRSLPSPGEPPSLETFTAAGPGWVAQADAALRAAAAGDAEAAGSAAAELSVLAERARMPVSAALLAEAASLCALDDAERALRVATLSRDRADHRSAEWWGKRAGMLAEQREEWETAVFAWSRVGDAFHNRNVLSTALFAWRKAAAMAERSASNDLIARTLHSLSVVSFESGQIVAAERYAARSLALYPLDHPRLWAFTHDRARMLLVSGEPARALPLLRWVAGASWGRRDRLTLLVNLARAAALQHAQSEYELAVEGAFTLLDHGGDQEGAVWALAELALAGTSCGDLRRARKWAWTAVSLTEGKNEKDRETQLAIATAQRVLIDVG